MESKEPNQEEKEVKIGKTIVIKDLGIEVETKISQKGTPWDDVIYPKGWRKLTKDEIWSLYADKKLRKQLNLNDTWEFIETFVEDFPVSRFQAHACRAYLDCYAGPREHHSSDSAKAVGIRFCRDMQEEKQ